MIQRYCILVLIFLLILSACGGDKDNDNSDNNEPTASIPTASSDVSEIRHEDGVNLSLPDADITAEISVAQSAPEVFETSYQLTSNVYAIEAGTKVFDTLVEIALPYDETALPEGLTEEEVFAVFWYDGEWIRVDGRIDTENNTIIVESFHASYWSTAYDIFATGLVTIGEFLELYDDVENIPQNVEQARQLVEERRQRYGEAIESAEFRVEALDEMSDIDNLIEASFDGAVHAGTELALEAGHYIAVEKFGNEAIGESFRVVSHGGQVVGIYNLIRGSWQLFESAVMSGDTLGAMLRVETAYQELREAEAMLWALEHPNAKTMPPEFAEALARVNWKIREEVFEIVETAEPEIVVTYQCTEDFERTFTIENRGGPMAFPTLYQIYTIVGQPLYGAYVRLDAGATDSATIDPDDGRASLEIDEYEILANSLCPQTREDEDVDEIAPSGDAATIRLIYTDDYLILSQLSAMRPDISGLTFVGSNGDSFAAIDWKDGTALHDDIYAMRQHTCVQVARSYDERLQHNFPDCRFTRGWVLSDGQFWRGDSFTVFNNGDEVATCELSAGTCDVLLAATTLTETVDTTEPESEAPNLVLSGVCADGVATFAIENAGGDMNNPTEWRLQDNDANMLENGTVQLASQETTELTFNISDMGVDALLLVVDGDTQSESSLDVTGCAIEAVTVQILETERSSTNSSFESTLSENHPEDNWLVNIDENAVLWIEEELSDGDLRYDIEVVGPTGIVEIFEDESAMQSYLLNAAGDYTVRVIRESGEGTYHMAIYTSTGLQDNTAVESWIGPAVGQHHAYFHYVGQAGTHVGIQATRQSQDFSIELDFFPAGDPNAFTFGWQQERGLIQGTVPTEFTQDGRYVLRIDYYRGELAGQFSLFTESTTLDICEEIEGHRAEEFTTSNTFGDDFICGEAYLALLPDSTIVYSRLAIRDNTVPFGEVPVVDLIRRCFQVDNLTTGRLGTATCIDSITAINDGDILGTINAEVPEASSGDTLRYTIWIFGVRYLNFGSSETVDMLGVWEPPEPVNGSYDQDVPSVYRYTATMRMP